jgi:hypothetical protein
MGNKVSGQIGLELIVGIGLIMLIFSTVVIIVIDKTAESSSLKTYLDARRVATSVKDNVDMISQQGPGYYKYFSVPEELYGGFEYNLSLSGNLLEVTWAENTWSTKVLSSNVSVYCMSKGAGVSNRIYYGENGLELTCHRPNLKVVAPSLVIDRVVNSTIVDVWNDAHVDSPGFTARFETNSTPSPLFIDRNVSGLAAGDRMRFQFNRSLTDYVSIYVDYHSVVNESIESDNNMTRKV